MYQGKLRKITIILLALYIVLILFFLYIGFNRASFLQDSSMRYSLIPDGIPLHFPIRFFELGNFVAFIPFGIVIPLLFRCNFIRFITLFILSITILEILQMLSRLGAFDIDDIIINTLGAAVGFWAQRLVHRDRDKFKGIFRIMLIAIVISIGTVTVVGSINNYLLESCKKYAVNLCDQLTINQNLCRRWKNKKDIYRIWRNCWLPRPQIPKRRCLGIW